MAIDGIGLSEPSTITKSLAAVPITRNSSVTYQEVMVLGSPNSTTALALAEVIGSAPASTTVGLVVRPIGPLVVAQSSAADLNVTVANFSTTVAVSSIAGPVTIRSSAANALVSVYQSTAADLNVTVAGYSTTVNISSLGGAVIVRSSAADAKVSVYQSTVGDLRAAVYQSTAGDLNVTVAGYSTTVNVSSLGGAVIVRSSAANALMTAYQSTAADLQATVTPAAGSTFRTQPGSTLWASSAGFHFDSSGALLISGASASTGVTVNRIVGNSSAADAVPVRLVLADGSTYVTPAIDYTHNVAVTASSVTGPAVMLYASSAAPSSVNDGNMVLQWGTQRGAANVALVTSSGADMSDSSNAALRVNVVAGSAAGSTTVNVSSLAGAVMVRSSAASFLASVYQSTAADLNATITPAAGSTFRTQPGSTLWASSAGFHFDSSGALLISGASASTQVAVSSIAGRVAIAGFNTADGIFSIGDSTNNALRVNVVAGAAGGSTEVTVRQSTYTDFNTLSRIADRDQSTQVANVTNTTPASTAYGLVVREAVAQSTGPFVISSIVGPVTVRSSAANFLASVYQSSAADLNVTVAGYSTTVAVSSIAGPVTVRSSAANALVSVYQSTVGDLLATVNNRDGTGNALESAVAQPSTAARGLIVRPVIGGLQTYAASTTGQSTATTVVSSNATGKAYVYAVTITSTHTAMTPGGFYSGSTLLWPFVISSGYGGLNLAISPPGYLFSGSTGQGLTFNVDSSNGGMRVGVAYWVST